MSNPERVELTPMLCQTIKTWYANESVAFTPVLVNESPRQTPAWAQWTLGVAVKGESGYTPLQPYWTYGATYDEMARYAERLNEELFGLDVTAGAEIVISTMGFGRLAQTNFLA